MLKIKDETGHIVAILKDKDSQPEMQAKEINKINLLDEEIKQKEEEE